MPQVIHRTAIARGTLVAPKMQSHAEVPDARIESAVTKFFQTIARHILAINSRRSPVGATELSKEL